MFVSSPHGPLLARPRPATGRRRAPGRPPTSAPALVEPTGFYVATTRAGEPLDRIASAGSASAAAAVISVHREGVRLEIAGERAVLVRASSIRDVGRATWTIDRVVETDGLVLVAWMPRRPDVDTYLRVDDDPRPSSTPPRALTTSAPTAARTPQESRH